jgi:hypothetical protein
VIVALVLINMISCSIIAVSALCLVTDHARSRSARVCCGLILCGAVVNIEALWVAFKALDPNHPMTWPTEAVLNIGSAVLLGRWALKGWLERIAAMEGGTEA